MLEHEDISYRIRSCVFEVYRTLGCGFLEKVYENALVEELRLNGLDAKAQVPISVQYKSCLVGEYFADILVNESILLELKAQQNLPSICDAQLLNYLKATGIKIGMLVNFAFPKATIRRLVV